MQKNDANKTIDSKKDIFLSIDHLKAGNYILNIISGNKIVKSIPIDKK